MTKHQTHLTRQTRLIPHMETTQAAGMQMVEQAEGAERTRAETARTTINLGDRPFAEDRSGIGAVSRGVPVDLNPYAELWFHHF
jgi:hypothetical protein